MTLRGQGAKDGWDSHGAPSNTPSHRRFDDCWGRYSLYWAHTRRGCWFEAIGAKDRRVGGDAGVLYTPTDEEMRGDQTGEVPVRWRVSTTHWGQWTWPRPVDRQPPRDVGVNSTRGSNEIPQRVRHNIDWVMKRGQRILTGIGLNRSNTNSPQRSQDQNTAIGPPTRSSDTRVLWQLDLAKRYDVNRVTICRWERANRLPPPDVIIGRHRGRYETTIIAFERASVGRFEPDPEGRQTVGGDWDWRAPLDLLKCRRSLRPPISTLIRRHPDPGTRCGRRPQACRGAPRVREANWQAGPGRHW